MEIIGVDLGGTQVRAGRLVHNQLTPITTMPVPARGSFDEVLETLYTCIDAQLNAGVAAIGVGVPSVVDVENGIVYDVQNIPAWQEVPLKALLEKKYALPVCVNNDANCFALAEFYFGAGKGFDTMVGLTIGTGLGAGIVIHKKLYAGANCGAGEFGMVPYLDKFMEWYASGSFFKNKYGISGAAVYALARQNDATALQYFAEFGRHLGNALQTILYTIDPQCIVFGGSVATAFELFEKPMQQQLQQFVYPRSLAKLQLKKAVLKNSGVLGAAALPLDGL